MISDVPVFWRQRLYWYNKGNYRLFCMFHGFITLERRNLYERGKQTDYFL